MAVEYLGSGNDDGTNFGRDEDDKIGFYGLTTPIAQQTLTSALSTDIGTTTDPYGATTLAQWNKLTALVNEIRAALIAVGLMK